MQLRQLISYITRGLDGGGPDAAFNKDKLKTVLERVLDIGEAANVAPLQVRTATVTALAANTTVRLNLGAVLAASAGLFPVASYSVAPAALAAGLVIGSVFVESGSVFLNVSNIAGGGPLSATFTVNIIYIEAV